MNIRGERILILGDSLSASAFSPGGVLGQLLHGAGAQDVHINARVGRSAISFIQGENGLSQIASDISQFKPTKVIVFLGTNDINRGMTTPELARTATAMKAIRDAYKLAHAEVVALGPPSYDAIKFETAAPLMLDTIRGVYGIDRTLDIRPLTEMAQRSGDGIHFTADGARDAAPQIAAALATLGVQPSMASTGMSTGAKIGLGALGVVGVVAASWFALRIAKRAAQSPYRLGPSGKALAFRLGREALQFAIKHR
jgi:lysophospholipase L1-like esterase